MTGARPEGAKTWFFELYTNGPHGEPGWFIEAGFIDAASRRDAITKLRSHYGARFDEIIQCYESCVNETDLRAGAVRL